MLIFTLFFCFCCCNDVRSAAGQVFSLSDDVDADSARSMRARHPYIIISVVVLVPLLAI